jgi:hypothetical protein
MMIVGGKRKVIKMAQKEYIKHLYEAEEKSLRKIAQVCELNFRTVQKYAKADDWNAGKSQDLVEK